MGSNAGKTKKPPNRAEVDRRGGGDQPWAEHELDMFETDAFRPDSGRHRQPPLSVRDLEPAPVPGPSGGLVRAAPMDRPMRQEVMPEYIQQPTQQPTLLPTQLPTQQPPWQPVGRAPVRSGTANPWLDESTWPQNWGAAPMQPPVQNPRPQRHPNVMHGFLPKPPPYQAVVHPIRTRPVGKPVHFNPVPEIITSSQKPLEELPDQAVADNPQATSKVDNDDPDLSNYRVTSLLSPDHVTHVREEPRFSIAPPTIQSVHEKDDDEYIGANLKFYRNQVPFRPNGEFIDYIHRYWHKNYRILEKSHTYIQWLFPISESSSVNKEAVPLRAHEAKYIYGDLETRNRFINSYKMMLDFYGFRIKDLKTGKVERKENWRERFYNLLRNTHNNARITRILKSLGELDLAHYQSPLVMALLHEVFETKHLHGITKSTIMHWIRAINNQFERDYTYKQFYDHIMKLDSKQQYPGKENTGVIVDKSQRDSPTVIMSTRKKY